MAVEKKAAGGKPSIVRPLGNVECYEFHMIQLGYLSNTIVNCRYTPLPSLAAPDLHDQVVARLEDAIARVVLEHPALRVDIINAETKRPAWVAVETVDLAHHVQWEDVKATVNYDEFLRERIEQRLDEPSSALQGRPKWRALVLVRTGESPFLDVIFDYNHALGDGTSGKIFHETLLRMLNTPATQPVLTNRVLRIPSTARSLAPPIEKICKFSFSAKYTISTAWKELKPRGFASPSASQANWAPIRATPYKTQFRTFDVEPELLQNILTACRTHKTTVTGLLQALVLVSIASHIHPRDATAFTGSTALDLRRHVPAHPGLEPKRTIADYVSVMAHEFDADLVRKVREAAASTSSVDDDTPIPALVDLVWQCATRVRGEIQKRLDLGLKNEIVGLMKLVPDWRAQHRTDASKPRPYSFVVTNLGVLDGAGMRADMEDSGLDRWGIEHSVFATSAEVCGAAFQVAPISVQDKALCVGCSWQDCVVDVKLAEAIVADLERWLRFLGKSS
ncbi:hypothetical protein HD806DRAFT_504690 [Xylariaceae sp. AK1471]|nr:hypothetical protein HD806DRAFT_504690 [Xylariaceae sp. AK1471]